MDRGREFARRAQTYRELDAMLQARTRFFAAAALTNSVLAQLFRSAPEGTLASAYTLLVEAGAVLEAANLRWAREIPQLRAEGELDEVFVRREQHLLQGFIDSAAAGPCARTRVCADISRLLNGWHWALLGASWVEPGRRFGRILGVVRRRLGNRFDFHLESHRVQLGLQIIREVRVH